MAFFNSAVEVLQTLVIALGAGLGIWGAMLPAFLFGMYERNGQPLEVVLRNIIRTCFLRPKQRPYKTNNFYDVLARQAQLDQEVYQIVHGKKADPRTKTADRSRHRKSEKDG